jgi:hypothetical protein
MPYQLQILSREQIDPARWDAFVDASPEGGLFSLYGYLSALNEHWQAAIVKDQKDQWMAIMPYATVRKWRYRMVAQPAFSQFWGPCFVPLDSLSTYKQYSRKRDWGQLLVQAWQEAHLVLQNCHPYFDCPMPFYEAGYEIHTRYTYVLDLGQEEEKIWMGLEPSLRRRIRRVEERGWSLVKLDHIDPLLDLYAAQKNQGHDILGVAQNAEQRLKKLTQYLQQNQFGQLWALQDEAQEVQAAAVIAHYKEKAFYLWGTYHPQKAPAGAMAWLIWQQIIRARSAGCSIFDFEGSMVPDIARFFRRFGARPIPYLQLYKNALPLLVRWIREYR